VPYQNRVDPFGEIVAVPHRGRWMGNRGIVHSAEARIVRRWQHPHWIICATSYKEWRAPQWTPHRYTPLFFLDEAVALAAGHRPCALCRRPRWQAFVDAWSAVSGDPQPRRDAIDRRLHAERRLQHQRPWRDLPDGTYALLDDAPVRVDRDHATPWTPEGYGDALPRPSRGDATVLTPSITVGVLAAGYALDV
jgi:hypothetical protein